MQANHVVGAGFFLTLLVLWAGSACAGDAGSLEQRVHYLIRELSIPATTLGPYDMYEGKQVQLFQQLEALGKPAIPYIIKYMDDRRPLPYRYIRLDNPRGPGVFEAFRQYGPEVVVDGLAALLNQMTRKDFGPIYNGGTETERDGAVAGWRAWCSSQWPDLKDVCAGPSRPQQ